MASGKKRRGPKPTPGASKRPGPSATPRAPKGAPVRPARGGIPTQWWIVIGVLVAALVVGIVVQSSRSESENSKVVTPKHRLGPDDSEIEGDRAAPVLLQEFADFQCPSCKAFHDAFSSTVAKLVAEKKIRFAYTYFPFIGDESVAAAAAAVCAGDEGKFFPYSDVLYTNQAPENSGFLTTNRLVSLGKDAGITGSAFGTFEKCVRAGTYEGFVRRSADNVSKQGIHQTPTLLLTGPNGKTTELTAEQLSGQRQFAQAISDAAKT